MWTLVRYIFVSLIAKGEGLERVQGKSLYWWVSYVGDSKRKDLYAF